VEDLKQCTIPKNEIIIPLTNSQCRIPYDYQLSHIPVFSPKPQPHLQEYYFPFTSKQLGEMFNAPKMIIDRWHDVFVSDSNVMHRTSFYAVAPRPFNKEDQIPQKDVDYDELTNATYLPILYRFSIIRNLENEQHYSITAHAIVGGKADGWLFLARLDNNAQECHNFIPENQKSSNFVIKKFNAIPVLTPKQEEIMSFFSNSIGEENGDEVYRGIMHRIAFPHIHQADAKYTAGTEPEKCCPKFLKHCVKNTFEENVAFMMKAFHISDKLHFFSNDTSLKNVILETQKYVYCSPEPSPFELINEIKTLERLNSANDFKLTMQSQGNKLNKRNPEKRSM